MSLFELEKDSGAVHRLFVMCSVQLAAVQPLPTRWMSGLSPGSSRNSLGRFTNRRKWVLLDYVDFVCPHLPERHGILHLERRGSGQTLEPSNCWPSPRRTRGGTKATSGKEAAAVPKKARKRSLIRQVLVKINVAWMVRETSRHSRRSPREYLKRISTIRSGGSGLEGRVGDFVLGRGERASQKRQQKKTVKAVLPDSRGRASSEELAEFLEREQLECCAVCSRSRKDGFSVKRGASWLHAFAGQNDAPPSWRGVLGSTVRALTILKKHPITGH